MVVPKAVGIGNIKKLVRKVMNLKIKDRDVLFGCSEGADGVDLLCH